MTGAVAYVRFARKGLGSPRLVHRALLVGAAAAVAYLAFAYLYGRSAAATNPLIAGSAARVSPLVSLGSSLTRALVMGAIVLGPLWLARPFGSRPLRRLARVSYGVYVIHLVIGLYAGYLLGLPGDGSPATVALWLAIVLVGSLAYAQASARLVEQPVAQRARQIERGASRSGGLTGSLAGAERAHQSVPR